MAEHRTRHYEPGGGNSAGAPQTRTALGQSIALDDGQEIRLYTSPRKEGEEFRVSIKSYRGHAYTDLRLWFIDRASGEWRPGKGITVKLRELAAVASALEEAANRIANDGTIRPTSNTEVPIS